MAKILIAEDEYVIAKGIQSKLESWGHEVAGIAASGEQAIRDANIDTPDLVLMDIMLKGEMNGIAAAARIRERAGIPVIYVTAYGSDESVREAALTNPYGFIVKPFNDETLRNAINSGLLKKECEQARDLLVRRLESYSGRLLTAKGIERRRIAYGLHEEMARILAALNMRRSSLRTTGGTNAAAPLRTMATLLTEQTAEQAHRMVRELCPVQLENLELSVVLRLYAAAQAELAGWKVHIDAREEGRRAPPNVEIACFYVFQEALVNILCHANATDVGIVLRRNAEELDLKITDNGPGFDLQSARRKAGGRTNGLLDMERRVKYAGGRLEISSAPGTGTRIRAYFWLQIAAPRRPR
ncbi:MAG: hypothetical protein A3H32_16585 [Betaproteobacteria bacterium RIFCSPLOWO2_02_FULL_63_19]|nr:MAG: hypothetical protein A3H32_16585 [Betaproteobacteria bacterium RIFCSPLOWO2_02_FULL_63_19]